MGLFYAIKRACTNRSRIRLTSCGLSIWEMSLFTMSTTIFGLRVVSDMTFLAAAYILRRVRFLRTAVLNVLLGAVGENLNLFAGTYLMLKRGECVSRPVFTTVLNSFIERRSAFESMICWLDGQTTATFGAAAFYDVFACSGLCSLAEAVRTCALSLFWIICEWHCSDTIWYEA